MKPVRFSFLLVAVISSMAAFFTHFSSAEVPASNVKLGKNANGIQKDAIPALDTATAFKFFGRQDPPKRADRYPWKQQIVTTTFWIGEQPTARNPVPNHSSSWDKNWSGSYGGFDNPNRARRAGYIPAAFTPRQNPFYCALPYNDKASTGHRPEAPQVVPWFKEAYQGPAVSTCKGRWIAIRKGNRVAYAQWEDAGPFRTDHWQYVFGNERPKPNLNKGAGLDVSPAVRDFIGLGETDVTDWRFVDFKEVPRGPWARYGDNNTFVLNQRSKQSLQVRENVGSPSR